MTLRSLHLASNLTLPLETVTQTIAILAKRRAGKSYTMRRLVEQLFKAGQQVVLVDPKGDQWGLRSAADGKAPGLPIVILGGERGDVPLESTSGEIVAKLVVEERVSVLLDLSLFRKHEVSTFMTAFLENLYRLKAKEIYRTPVMLVIDEADAVAPQKPQKGEERMLGAAEDIVRRGGQRGIGCVLVSQRSAVLNKNVLTQAQMLVVLRTIAPQDLAAMKAWIDVHGDEEQGKTLMDSLPSLPIGDAWFWSPGWPTVDGIFKRVHVLPIETFDSGKSPDPGVKPVVPKNLADVDLNALKGQMAATIEKAKADDPRELRKQIAELKKQLTLKVLPLSEKLTAPVGKAKPILTDADRALLERIATTLAELRAGLREKSEARIAAVARDFSGLLNTACLEAESIWRDVRVEFEKRMDSKGFQKILDKLATVPQPDWSPANKLPPRDVLEKIARAEGRRLVPPSTRSTPARQVSEVTASSPLPPGEHATLTAALQYPDGLNRKRLGILTGYKRSSRDAYIFRLGQKGLVSVNGAFLFPTDAGRAVLNGSFEPLPTGAALIEYWRAKLPDGERATLEVLIEAEGKDVERERIDETTGYKRSSRDAYLTRLKARGLVEFASRGLVRASSELFT